LSAEEGRDVRGEVRVVLEQEPVGGVGVDLDAGLRDQAGEQMGVVGRIIGSRSPLAMNTGHLQAADLDRFTPHHRGVVLDEAVVSVRADVVELR
jgi:hypothetical protein